MDQQLTISWRRAVRIASTQDANYRGPFEGESWSSVLRRSQQAWNRYRNAHCLSESYRMRGGNSGGNLEASCRIRLARERIDELEVVFEGMR
ncbi:MAG: DUF1311 domain-containing protein [Sphingomonadaceae bacterium]|nr:DUF1311 domain-containing protein [Sphingomonadaceae bacterium]